MIVAASVVPSTIANAYRTGADLPELRGTERVSWSVPRVPYRVHERGGPGVAATTVRDTAEQAFREWSGLACASVEFRYSGVSDSRARPDDGFNDIYWIRETGLWAEEGLSPDALAITDITYQRPEGGDWEIVEADILLNGTTYRWSASAGDPDEPVRSLRATLTHEAGHFLGLLHICDVGDDAGAPACSGFPDGEAHVMFPGYVGPAHHELSSDDQAGACFLYDCSVTGCSGDLACVEGSCVEPCGGDVCDPGESCGPDGCRNPMCPGPDCSPGCEEASECEAGELCRAGRCIPDGGPDGDPCSADGDCTSRHCGTGGFCTSACSEDAACSGGRECVAISGGSECVPGSGVFGDPCAAADDCSAGLCLENTSGRSLCTRTCSGTSACPAGNSCTEIDGRDVCVPTDSGCAVRPGAREIPHTALLLCAAFMVLFRRRRTES